MTFDVSWLLPFSGAFAVLGCAASTYFALSEEGSSPRRAFRHYSARLDRHASFLLMKYSGAQIAKAQVVLSLICILVFALTRRPVFALGALLSGAVPPFLLWKRHIARIARLEHQLDTWLLMLANALKSTSSVGEAIASTVTLVPNPFSEEVDLLVKEIRLGAPLDRAVNAMASRINSTLISGALATIVVARQTGGDLPRTLERAAAALREAARLEGVLRTKTAEGRGQVLVLASVPFVLCIIIAFLDRSWFDPMLNHRVGQAILAACALAWTIASIWAHQIVKADL